MSGHQVQLSKFAQGECELLYCHCYFSGGSVSDSASSSKCYRAQTASFTHQQSTRRFFATHARESAKARSRGVDRVSSETQW